MNQTKNSRLKTGEAAPALTDLDTIIKLKQDFLPAYLPRAQIHLAQKDAAAARADLAALDRLAPKQADLRLQLGHVYGELQEPAAAVVQFDAWIDAHPDDARLVGALSSRCMMRVVQNQDLALALDDCSKALKRADRHDPNNALLYVHRGMVHLRQGDNDKAIADFNDALKLQPNSAPALFGRGSQRRIRSNPRRQRPTLPPRARWSLTCRSAISASASPHSAADQLSKNPILTPASCTTSLSFKRRA